MIYILPFIISFCLSILFCGFLIFIFRQFFLNQKNLINNNRKSSRHIHLKNKHSKYISRFGGMAIILSFIFTLWLNADIVFEQITYAIILGAILILIFGIIDDIFEINWRWQIIFQITIICLVFFLGVQIDFITNPFGGVILFNLFFSFIFTLVWILVIMNAINWSDGVDGLAGGITFLAAIVLFFLALRPEVNQPPLAIIAIILAGSILGFLIFNFPPAKIFAGTSGSFFMGYLVAVLAIFAGAKIGATLLVLAVPLTDAVFVIWQRLKNKQSIFQADTKHMHHHLLQLNWSMKKIAIFYYTITIIGAVAALSTQAVSKFITFSFFVLLIFSFCYFLDRRVKDAI